MILGRRRQGLIAATIALIGAVPVVDRVLPPTTHLAPVLGLAPALAAVYAGPRPTLLIGALAIAALAIAAIERSTLATETVIVQLVSLAALSTLLAFFTYVRARHQRQMARIRSVSEAAQRVVSHPLPQRSGPVSIASRYRAADADMHLGGDFYALARTADSTRVIIGDVRGKGLASISETAAMLESFRAAARQEMSLPEMVRYMDSGVLREMGEHADRARPRSPAWPRGGGQRLVPSEDLPLRAGRRAAALYRRKSPRHGILTAPSPRSPSRSPPGRGAVPTNWSPTLRRMCVPTWAARSPTTWPWWRSAATARRAHGTAAVTAPGTVTPLSRGPDAGTRLPSGMNVSNSPEGPALRPHRPAAAWSARRAARRGR